MALDCNQIPISPQPHVSRDVHKNYKFEGIYSYSCPNEPHTAFQHAASTDKAIRFSRNAVETYDQKSAKQL